MKRRRRATGAGAIASGPLSVRGCQLAPKRPPALALIRTAARPPQLPERVHVRTPRGDDLLRRAPLAIIPWSFVVPVTCRNGSSTKKVAFRLSGAWCQNACSTCTPASTGRTASGSVTT